MVTALRYRNLWKYKWRKIEYYLFECNISTLAFLFFSFLFFGTQEALDHLASFPSSRETVSQPWIEPQATPFSLGTIPLSSGSLGSCRTLSSTHNMIYIALTHHNYICWRNLGKCSWCMTYLRKRFTFQTLRIEWSEFIYSTTCYIWDAIQLKL